MAQLSPFEEPIPKDILRKVADVVPRLEIEDVRLIGLSSKLKAPPHQDAAIDVSTSHDSDCRIVGETRLVARLSFTLKATSSAEPPRDVFEVAAVYRVVYSSDTALTELSFDNLKTFAAVNAVHNVWPYWRELVQSVVSRMGLPPLTVPLLKVRKPEAPKETPAELKAAEPT